MLEEEVERLTEQMESSEKPNAFNLCRRGAILRKVQITQTHNSDHNILLA